MLSLLIALTMRALDDIVINLEEGPVRVEHLELPGSGAKSILRARGIPFAEPPLGQLRWQPPVSTTHTPWTTPVDATNFGPDCINAPWYQRFLFLGLNATMAESCLFLNVWAPYTGKGPPGRRNTSANSTNGQPNDDTDLLPVMFWVHGGSFAYGGSTVFSADNVMKYRQDTLVVTTNYRLGALGFLGGDAVAATTRDGSAGNFGVQDVREALRWVQRNIRAFGGDPNRVTLFGESSGASLVAVHLVAPRSAGLFAQAMMQSGPFDNYTVQTDPAASFRTFAAHAGCDGGGGGGSGSNRNLTDAGLGGGDADADEDLAALACLRRRPAALLLPAIGNTSADGWFSPCVDGVELAAEPEVLARRGGVRAAHPRLAAVALGTNRNEGRFLMPLAQPVPNAPRSSLADVRAWLAAGYPAVDPDAVLGEYAAELRAGMTPWELASRIYTDSQYFCPTRRSAGWLLGNASSPSSSSSSSSSPSPPSPPPSPPRVYIYRLDYEPRTWRRETWFYFWLDWCYAYADYSPLCRNLTSTLNETGVGHGAVEDDPNDKRVALQMIEYWHNFAVHQDPSPLSLPATPPAASPAAVALRPPSSPSSSSSAPELPTWPPFTLEGNASNLIMVIDAPMRTRVAANVDVARCQFWDSTHPLYTV